MRITQGFSGVSKRSSATGISCDGERTRDSVTLHQQALDEEEATDEALTKLTEFGGQSATRSARREASSLGDS